jgi:hypothetical protein
METFSSCTDIACPALEKCLVPEACPGICQTNIIFDVTFEQTNIIFDVTFEQEFLANAWTLKKVATQLIRRVAVLVAKSFSKMKTADAGRAPKVDSRLLFVQLNPFLC